VLSDRLYSINHNDHDGTHPESPNDPLSPVTGLSISSSSNGDSLRGSRFS